MLGSLAVFVTVCATAAFAAQARQEGGETMVPGSNKTECIKQMLEWCNGMQYPKQGAGLALLSVTYEDPSGYYRVFCSSDSDGTNCTRNSMPWFTCSSSNREFSYKGQAVSEATAAADVDNDICRTADKAFNDLFVQNLTYDNETLQTEVNQGMESFFQQMAMMEQQIAMIQKMMKNVPYFTNYWNGFAASGGSGQTTVSSAMPEDNTQARTDQKNQIEKE